MGLLSHLPQKNEFRVANSGHSTKFATQEVLAQLKTGSQPPILVANVGSTVPFATRIQRCVANSGDSARFATQEGLNQPEIGCQLLTFVANVRIMLHLPHKFQRRVANSGHSARFATRTRPTQLGAW